MNIMEYKNVTESGPELAGSTGSDASFSIRRPSVADGREIIQVDVEWAGNKLRLETSLAEFARIITGGNSAETKVVRWRTTR